MAIPTRVLFLVRSRTVRHVCMDGSTIVSVPVHEEEEVLILIASKASCQPGMMGPSLCMSCPVLQYCNMYVCRMLRVCFETQRTLEYV